MFVNEIEFERIEDGLSTAMRMMVDDQICAVVVIGVHNDGRGIKVWTAGDDTVVDQVRAGISESLPYKPRLSSRLRDPEDGA